MPIDPAELEAAAIRAETAKNPGGAQEERVQLERARALEEGFEERPAPEGEEPEEVVVTAAELDRCRDTIKTLTERTIALQAELNQYYEEFGPLTED